MDDGASLGEDDIEYLAFFLVDERRHQDRTLAGGCDTMFHVIGEGLWIALCSCIEHGAAYMNGGVAGLIEQFGVPDSAIDTTGDIDVRLHAEEAGFKALGSEALRVHIDIMNSRGKPAILTHRADVRHLGEDRRGGSGRYYRPGTRRKMRGSRRGVIIASRFLGTLPEAAGGGLDALRKGLADIPNHMKMIGHKAIMKHLYHGVMSGHLADAFKDSFTKIGIVDPSLGRIVIGDEELTEQRLAGGDRQGDMVETGAFPCFAGVLPFPCVVIIGHIQLFLAGDSIALEYKEKYSILGGG